MSVESFSYSNYVITEQRQSKIDRKVSHTIEVGLTCPRCKRPNPPLDHAEGVTCDGCKLHMCRYGNGLTCTAGTEQDLRDGLNLGPMAPPLTMLQLVKAKLGLGETKH